MFGCLCHPPIIQRAAFCPPPLQIHNLQNSEISLEKDFLESDQIEISKYVVFSLGDYGNKSVRDEVSIHTYVTHQISQHKIYNNLMNLKKTLLYYS